ncbi:hypothetical protein MEG1DRAFT_02053 [Photorhabdus temperata subsp. temperata Meg1]|uniref:Uncharacterized protein n=1 Tax=Photorhabdus temperata subsp. temperata Meg1 TaxID=1393735 RepID=A0A081RXH2_PHOTE|nr:hypothetical protein MEG1DRAFT_02053 [Photorhabdus temperata subsp. temperata Meg1]
MAEGREVWQAGTGRDHNSALQDADWPAPACAEFCDAKAIRVVMLNRLLAVARPQGGESRLTRWGKGDF